MHGQRLRHQARALRADGLSWSEVSRRLRVARSTLRAWEADPGRGRPGCPRCDGAELDTEAYAELLGWYLGDGHITRGRRGVHDLHVVNDRRYVADNAGLATLLATVKPGGLPHTRLVPGAVITTVSWKHWPCLFPQHGPGRKHERPIVLDDWQRAVVEDHPGPFLRGLFHSDGSRVRNWATRPVGGVVKRYDYPRWQFVNVSPDIRELCGPSPGQRARPLHRTSEEVEGVGAHRSAATEGATRLETDDLAGIAWRQCSPTHVSVSRRDDVARLDALIGLKE